ncbi:MAG TPA: hypothetical protein VFT78_00070 [Hanamia sp.]|nr:hypothetical protein [Hanamia sp.]
MKSSIIIIAGIFVASFANAQSSKYESAMKENINQLDSVMVKNNAMELANNFVRIAQAEKTQWLPYYYAAYCKVEQAMQERDNSKKDALADEATGYLTKAQDLLGKENSEIDVIKSMIATVHMTVDPQSRYMTYMSDINDNIQKAEALDSTNPRPVLLQAENKFFTPEQYGGGKEVAKEYFEKADSLDKNFKPETELSPNWGRTALNYFLSQYK